MESSSEKVITHSSLSDTFSPTNQSGDNLAAATNALAGLKKSIRQLKAIMLSLEWDLSTETLRQLDVEIAAQQARWEDDKSITGLLRILGALGTYIGRIRAKTHPLAIKLFFAVYNGLEKIVLSPDMPEAKKKKIVLLAYQRYNQVKEKLALREKLIAQQLKNEGAATSGGATGKEQGASSPSVAADSPVSEESAEPAEEVSEFGADQGESVAPALCDADFSAEEEEKRKIWLEDDEPGELDSKLSTFFGEVGEEERTVAASSEDGLTSLPAGESEQQKGAGMDARDGGEEEVGPDEEGRKGVIDELFSQTAESEADELLTDMHLSVFSSDKDIPAPVSIQNPQQDEGGPGDNASLDAQVSEKLDAFFDESAPEGGADGEEKAKASVDTASPGPEVTEEEFADDVQNRLDSFFDEEGQGDAQEDAEVVPLQQAAGVAGLKPDDLLQELLKEIGQQSDGYKHFPEEEERGLLSNLFGRVEKAFLDTPEVLIPLCLLNTSLFSFEGSKEPTHTEVLECASDLGRTILSFSANPFVDKKDFAKLLPPLKKFLTLIESVRTGQQVEGDANRADDGNANHRDGRSRQKKKKKSRPESQYKAKSDLIIEDLFSDE